MSLHNTGRAILMSAIMLFAAVMICQLGIPARAPGLSIRHENFDNSGLEEMKDGFSKSTNWAGYAVQTSGKKPSNDVVTDVKGSWKVPTVTASTDGKAYYSSIWVGIDGYSSSSVEQIGTEQDAKADGTTAYYA
jgi:hypothetical protein